MWFGSIFMVVALVVNVVVIGKHIAENRKGNPRRVWSRPTEQQHDEAFRMHRQMHEQAVQMHNRMHEQVTTQHQQTVIHHSMMQPHI